MTQVSVSEAKTHLTALVRRAEAGEDVVLTRNGQSVARITASPPPGKRPLTIDEKKQIIAQIQASARNRLEPGFSAARSQDFLYDDDGLPE